METTRTPGTIPSIDVVLPPRWRRRHDPEAGVVVAARPRRVPPSGVSPEVVVRMAAVDHDSLLTWRTCALADLAERLVDFVEEDADTYVQDDGAGDVLDVDYRRWAHRVGSADVVAEQWSWLLPSGVGIVLTASVAREDYVDYYEVFEAVASTVRLA